MISEFPFYIRKEGLCVELGFNGRNRLIENKGELLWPRLGRKIYKLVITG